MIGENFPFLIAISILSVVFILSFFHIYSGFLEKEETVNLNQKGLAILSAFLGDYDPRNPREFNCSAWRNRTVVNYNIESPFCEKIGDNITFNETEEVIRLSSPVLVKNDTKIEEVNVSIWK